MRYAYRYLVAETNESGSKQRKPDRVNAQVQLSKTGRVHSQRYVYLA